DPDETRIFIRESLVGRDSRRAEQTFIPDDGSRGRSPHRRNHLALNSRSVFSRNWPQAASMSWPFSRLSVAVTFCFSSAARNASEIASAGRSHGRPSTLLYG